MRCYDCAIHYSFFFHIAIKTVENKFSLFVKYKHVLPLCYQSIYPSSSSSHCRHVVTAVTSWCRLHIGCGFVVAIVVSPLSSHRGGVVIAVMSLRGLCRRIVAVSSSPSWCCLRVCHGFVIAVTVLPSHRSWFCHCRHQKKSTFLTTSYYILSHLIPLILGVRKE